MKKEVKNVEKIFWQIEGMYMETGEWYIHRHCIEDETLVLPLCYSLRSAFNDMPIRVKKVKVITTEETVKVIRPCQEVERGMF